MTTPGPAVDLIEHAAGIIVTAMKQPHSAPYHWAGALWEAGMLVAPGTAHFAATPATPGPCCPPPPAVTAGDHDTAAVCATGRDPGRCCVGDPWAGFTAYDTEPLDPDVIRVAAAQHVDPHALDQHVGVVHGWEPHDVGYDRAVLSAAECLQRGSCG